MNYLDKFRYSFDNLDEINIKKDVVVIKKKYAKRQRKKTENKRHQKNSR